MKTYHFCVIARRAQFLAPDVAIFKPKVWHPGTKHGIGKRQNSQILIRPAGTPICVIARSAATRQSLTERNGIPERSLEKQREAVCVLHARHHLVLLVSCSRISLWDSMPQTLRLPRPPCGLAMTRNRSVLFGKQIFLVVFSCFRLELTSAFPAKPTDSVIARSAATWQSLSRRHGIPERSTGSENDRIPKF